jgi:hypothetical protein
MGLKDLVHHDNRRFMPFSTADEDCQLKHLGPNLKGLEIFISIS